MQLMGSLFRNYLSNRALFFDLFDKAAKNAVEMATLLVSVINTGIAAERDLIFNQINKMENTGDDITHKIYLCLDKIVFTPLNRNGIHTLASAIDDVADTIQEASNRMYLYNIVEFSPPIKEIAAIILKASLEIEKAVKLLRVAKKPEALLERCLQIKTYERQSDQVYYHALADLFMNDKDAINLIKYREILYSLNNSVNKCKNTADTLEVILINR
jgi:predicted phosphate transport protein (TIGR00153 family)